MTTLFILNDPPYGTERSYNALRLAAALAKREGGTVQVFLMGDAAAHPIARVVVRFAGERGVAVHRDEVSDFVATPGLGVQARVGGMMLWAGTEGFAASGLVAADDANIATHVAARTEDGLRGVLSIGDDVRAGVADVIRRLKQLGIRSTILLTGDGPGPAEAVRIAAGVDQVRARLLPADKARAVSELRESFGSVAMVGDGVNDAPALATATVGVAMGAAGSPATIETADVALMADDLSRLPYAIALARRARQLIRVNIGLAIGLKVVLGVGAVAGVVNLALAVLVGDLGASLAVTASALRLAQFQERA